MIEKGELITLSNGKEYVCYYTIQDNGNNYVYLISNFKPLEIRFGIQRYIDGNIQIEIINEPEEKQKVLALFKNINKNS